MRLKWQRDWGGQDYEYEWLSWCYHYLMVLIKVEWWNKISCLKWNNLVGFKMHVEFIVKQPYMLVVRDLCLTFCHFDWMMSASEIGWGLLVWAVSCDLSACVHLVSRSSLLLSYFILIQFLYLPLYIPLMDSLQNTKSCLCKRYEQLGCIKTRKFIEKLKHLWGSEQKDALSEC